MPYYRLVLAYDGTDFQGWQAQKRECRTVQGVLEDALSRLAGNAPVRVSGAGRTDAGVHALGQVAAVQLSRDLAPPELLRALNGLLPEDVRAREACLAPAGFHPRRSAVSKLYRYVLDTGPVQLPTRRRYAAHVPWALAEEAVRAAAGRFEGRHDFASLMSSGSSVRTSVRTVLRSEARFEGPADGRTLVYEVEAEGFLRKMVRSLVGALVAVGRGVLTSPDLDRALAARDRRGWPAPAEARGLTLVSVAYETTMLR